MVKNTCAVGLAGWLVLAAHPGTRAGFARTEGSTTAAGPRRPVALVLAPDGKHLFAANRRAGSIAILDLQQQRLTGEVRVGRRLAGLAATPSGSHLLGVDEEANELLVLKPQGPTIDVLHRVSVSATPVSLRISADGSWCSVASLWSRRLSLVELPGNGGKPRVVRSVTLPFAPRLQLIVRQKVVVADAFGGRLALVDAARGTLLAVRALPGHNIRGLCSSADGKELLLAHQVLNPFSHTTADDIHWGNVIANKLRVLPLAAVLAAEADLLHGSRVHDLGDVGQGAGDPAGLVAGADGTVLVALAGTSELAVGTPAAAAWTRLPVGRRPTALVLSADGSRAYVANTLGDSVTVVNVPGRKAETEILLGARREPDAIERGERLFHDARLSHGGWYSCQSCHTDGQTNGLRADTLGDGSYGAPKRVPSLLGVKDSGPWAWNGSMPTLREQIRKSVETTMRGPDSTETQVHDLEAYLRTLTPPPSLTSAAEAAEAGRRGQALFAEQRCGRCHQPPTYTTPRTYDVGLVDEVGNRLFNPPSLRGVGQGGPYFHDGRAATLDEVFTRFRHELRGELDKQRLNDLLAFLRDL